MFSDLKQVSKCHTFRSDSSSSNGTVVPRANKGVPGRRDTSGMLWDALLITHEDLFVMPSALARASIKQVPFQPSSEHQ